MNRIMITVLVIVLMILPTTIYATPTAIPVTYEQATWFVKWLGAFIAFCTGVDFGQQALKL